MEERIKNRKKKGMENTERGEGRGQILNKDEEM